MHFSLLLNLLLSACCAISVDGAVYVGFDLKPTYGTSAIAFANGSLAAVAYVAGNADYQKTMRKLSLESSTHRAYVKLIKCKVGD